MLNFNKPLYHLFTRGTSNVGEYVGKKTHRAGVPITDGCPHLVLIGVGDEQKGLWINDDGKALRDGTVGRIVFSNDDPNAVVAPPPKLLKKADVGASLDQTGYEVLSYTGKIMAESVIELSAMKDELVEESQLMRKLIHKASTEMVQGMFDMSKSMSNFQAGLEVNRTSIQKSLTKSQEDGLATVVLAIESMQGIVTESFKTMTTYLETPRPAPSEPAPVVPVKPDVKPVARLTSMQDLGRQSR